MADCLAFAVPKLLDLLDADAQAVLFNHTRQRRFKAGQLIHQRGDTQGAIGIVISGAVQLLRREADGQVVSDSTVTAGQHYGDVSVLNPGGHRTHEAVALEDSMIKLLDRAAFESLLAIQPAIVNALYRIAVERMALTIALFDDARTLRPTDRIRKALSYAVAGQGGDPLVRCRQEDLAQLLGLSSVTVSKALSVLQTNGQIRLGYRSIMVCEGEAKPHPMT